MYICRSSIVYDFEENKPASALLYMHKEKKLF